MTIKIDRADATKLVLACIHIKYEFEEELIDCATDEQRERCKRSAEMWDRIYQGLAQQIKTFDEKRG